LRASLSPHKLGKLTTIGAFWGSVEDKQACFARIFDEVMSILKTDVAEVDEHLPPIVDEDFDTDC
jgi:hypothetical protein